MNRIHSLYAYFRRKYKCRIQKLPLDANATCPNRDGTVATYGCTFCNAKGSGTGLAKIMPSLREQAHHWQQHYNRADMKNIAYLQSFSNTHCSPERLQQILKECNEIPNLLGIAIGTRADCLDDEKIAILADIDLPEVWLEIGVQSIHTRTLERINRGHLFDIVPDIVRKASEQGIFICLHLMAGLPGESAEDFLSTLHTVLSLPIHALKIHNTFVNSGTVLEQEYKRGDYTPLTQEEYIELMCRAIPSIPSHIILQRIIADPEKTLVAPTWAGDKNKLTRLLPDTFEERGIWQGCDADVPNKLPLWFSSIEELPHALHEDYMQEIEELHSIHPWLVS
ncbi:MAG: TIGR01212 family radical SAM protein [Desulfovibrionaceae bacterium]|nr:TIGR01212 family radical SAM protein [Desulfovibrionaceae bacterium]